MGGRVAIKTKFGRRRGEKERGFEAEIGGGMEKLIESILRRIEADMNSSRIFEFLSLSLSPIFPLSIRRRWDKTMPRKSNLSTSLSLSVSFYRLLIIPAILPEQ